MHVSTNNASQKKRSMKKKIYRSKCNSIHKIKEKRKQDISLSKKSLYAYFFSPSSSF